MEKYERRKQAQGAEGSRHGDINKFYVTSPEISSLTSYLMQKYQKSRKVIKPRVLVLPSICQKCILQGDQKYIHTVRPPLHVEMIQKGGQEQARQKKGLTAFPIKNQLAKKAVFPGDLGDVFMKRCLQMLALQNHSHHSALHHCQIG